jgi:hypothetical protein
VLAVPHTLPHAPQLLLSLSIFVVQPVIPPQLAKPGAHTAHVPPKQDSPVGHTLPHAPQLFASFWKLTHIPMQFVNPGMHGISHNPFVHTSPVGHAVPQAPQLLGSEAMLTQDDPQLVRPATHGP